MAVGPFCVGVDLSTHAIDLIRLDENTNKAEWVHLELIGPNAWERTRAVRYAMPTRSWWDDVFLVAIERPMGFASGALARVQGAVLASIPETVTAWDVQPQTWKAALGIKARTKPVWADFPPVRLDASHGGVWDGTGAIAQDALDALGVALWARDLNAAGIAKALQGAA
jgi:hypothetical protein